MLILGFETSCDETSAAVVEMADGSRRILSNIVASQIPIHTVYGGVVPEIASRAHAEAISGVTREVLDKAGITVSEVDAIAVTNRPGLIGSLLVGVSFAKSLALAYGKPLVPVDHIPAHVAANYFTHQELDPPFFALVVSGGHTSLIRFDSHTEYETVGRTRDDAAGECFDKAARVMGIPYPGGAELDRLAHLGRDNVKLPTAALRDDTLDFSFSGLKTAIINHLHNLDQKGESYSREDVAASLMAAVASSFTSQLGRALEIYSVSRLVLAGGVAANSHLRSALQSFSDKRGIRLYLPERSLCGDNAAMVGAQGYYEYLAGHTAGSELNAYCS